MAAKVFKIFKTGERVMIVKPRDNFETKLIGVTGTVIHQHTPSGRLDVDWDNGLKDTYMPFELKSQNGISRLIGKLGPFPQDC